ncbi:MAG TPA: iron uptake system protein EfeO [Ktedonobacteraceae bacterium]|nr:iron uptake system protein EfeO [Ktedonobacteraceae bacterium]
MYTTRISRPILYCLLLLLLAGCGGTTTTTTHTTQKPTMTITTYDNYFDPKTVNVPPNQPVTVTLVNKGTNIHIVDILGLIPETTLQPGAQAQFTITAQPRAYKMYDELYVGAGMVGVYSGAFGTPQATVSTSQATTVQGAIQTYRNYVLDQADQMVQNTKLFVAAINAGDLNKAKQLYAPAHQDYERIEPIASSFKDLDARLDARENNLPANQWMGFHRIEKALWIDGTTRGLDTYTQNLLSDVLKLRLEAQVVQLAPTDVVDGAVALLDEASHNKITGEEDRYSHTDLYDLDANIEGSLAAFEVFRVFLEQKDPALLKDVETKFQHIQEVLKPFRVNNGFVAYNTLTDSDKRSVAQAIDAAGEPLSKVAVQLPSA